MAKNLSGLNNVGYDTAGSGAGGSYTAMTGKISNESSVEAPPIETETTTGLLYGGGQFTMEVMFLDYADFSTAQGWMTNDTEVGFKFDFEDGTTLYTVEQVQPFAERQVGVDARDGVVAWILSAERYTDEPMLTT